MTERIDIEKLVSGNLDRSSNASRKRVGNKLCPRLMISVQQIKVQRERSVLPDREIFASGSGLSQKSRPL
jgi:hypothetical protein